jgi:phage terminase large subunit
MLTTTVYKKNYDSTKKYVVNQGGTSSGKTYSILQLLFTYCISKPNLVITVCGQDIPNLKKGAFRDATNIFNNLPELKKRFTGINQSDRIFNCKNGSIIEFSSFSDEQDAKSGKRDYLFINEANGIPYEIFWQLAIRTRKKVFIDYNPTSRFWVHEKLIIRNDCDLIISDHRHNPFLPKEMHEEIESIEDEELFKVYARGKTGLIQGLVYNNWHICQSMPEIYKKRWIGIDFGYSNHPTAIIDVRLSEGQLWVDELCYSRKMLNSDIFDVLKNNEVLEIPAVADCAEAKSIAEINNMGAVNIEPSKKGADSINAGIDILKRYRINVTNGSINIKKELSSYKWKKDKASGDLTNKPEDHMNHALDAIRYVALNKLSINDNPFGKLNQKTWHKKN